MCDGMRIGNSRDAGEMVERLMGEGQLTSEQAAALRQFLENAGGLENARAALQTLEELEKAA